jgi:hypothetical protein
MSDVTYERAVDLMEAELGDELVALNIESGNCFGFNSVATSVWRALARPQSFIEIKSLLLEEYDVPEAVCTDALSGLLDDMIEKQLVRVRMD